VKNIMAVLMLVPLLGGAAIVRAQQPAPPDPASAARLGLTPEETNMLLLTQADNPMPGPKGQRRSGRGGRRGPADIEQQRKFLEQLRVLKLLEVLDLREDQEPKFLQAFSDMRREQRQIEQDRAAVIDTLSRDLREKRVDVKRLDQIIDRLSSLGKQRVKLATDFIASMRRLLTPEQLGRLIVFQDRFEYELLERVRGFRARMQGGSAGDSASGGADDQ
jgi:hypothetical protein